MDRKQRFKVIFFDIDDTIFPTTKFAEVARDRSLEKVLLLLSLSNKLHISKDEAIQFFEEVYDDFKYDFRDLFEYFFRRLEFETDLRLSSIEKAILIAQATLEFDKEIVNSMTSYHDIKTVLTALTREHYELGIITNGTETFQAYKIIKLDIDHFFKPNYIFISDVIGIRKPRPAIFKEILRKLDLDPSSCVYIGDNPINDIEPAAEAGLITIHIKRDGGKHVNKKSPIQPCFTLNDNLNDLPRLLMEDICNAHRSCENFNCPIKKSL